MRGSEVSQSVERVNIEERLNIWAEDVLVNTKAKDGGLRTPTRSSGPTSSAALTDWRAEN